MTPTATGTRPRVLFVDDEPSIRMTLPVILELHGYEVTVCATVTEALQEMQHQKFDVLLSDLNIGQPGDGFTVVSAMRRTQPQAVTLIITGYPGFETALQAIRSQVDDYIVKPASAPRLIELLQQKLADKPVKHDPVPLKRIGELLRAHKSEIIERWLNDALRPHEERFLSLGKSDRVNQWPEVLDNIVDLIMRGESEISEELERHAKQHGEQRYFQGYTVPMLVDEVQMFDRLILRMVQENLLAVDLSYLMSDVIGVSDLLRHHLRVTIESYEATLRRERKAS